MLDQETETLSGKIIGAAIEVHKTLGPGLLESAYQQALAYEFAHQAIDFKIEVSLSVVYKEVKLDCAFKADFVVEDKIIVELKAVERLMPIHQAQLLTYLQLTKIRLGLLFNFNNLVLTRGIKRMIL
ncbi:MAG TPA: GxxExxY protein [bacterium]|nr:GxxExxY protein [bacterium]